MRLLMQVKRWLRPHAGSGERDKGRDLRFIFKIELITFANGLGINCVGERGVRKDPLLPGTPRVPGAGSTLPFPFPSHASQSCHFSTIIASSLKDVILQGL